MDPDPGTKITISTGNYKRAFVNWKIFRTVHKFQNFKWLFLASNPFFNNLAVVIEKFKKNTADRSRNSRSTYPLK